MDKYTIDETQYKNGYRKGYEDGKRDAVKHGRWKIHGDIAVCNLCNSHIVAEQGAAELNYCYNCGARMDGAEDGN